MWPGTRHLSVSPTERHSKNETSQCTWHSCIVPDTGLVDKVFLIMGDDSDDGVGGDDDADNWCTA